MNNFTLSKEDLERLKKLAWTNCNDNGEPQLYKEHICYIAAKIIEKLKWIDAQERKPKTNSPVFAKLSCGKTVLAAIVELGDEDITFDWAQMMTCGCINEIDSYEYDGGIDVVSWRPLFELDSIAS